MGIPSDRRENFFGMRTRSISESSTERSQGIPDGGAPFSSGMRDESIAGITSTGGTLIWVPPRGLKSPVVTSAKGGGGFGLENGARKFRVHGRRGANLTRRRRRRHQITTTGPAKSGWRPLAMGLPHSHLATCVGAQTNFH